MTVRVPLLARRLHKWVALLVGLQLLIWTVTGLYMVTVDLDFIHGDHLVKAQPRRAIPALRLADPLAVARQVAGAKDVRLYWRKDRPSYAVSTEAEIKSFDAVSGAALLAPTAADIRRAAQERFTGSADIASAVLLAEPPFEVRGRKGPLWRVQFQGWNKPTFYLSAQTGELLSQRHELWRTFDFFFGLHVMDYWTRENVNNPLLRVVSWIAAIMALSGAWLLLYSFPRRAKRKAA